MFAAEAVLPARGVRLQWARGARASKVSYIDRSRCFTRLFGRAPEVSTALSSAIAARNALLAYS